MYQKEALQLLQWDRKLIQHIALSYREKVAENEESVNFINRAIRTISEPYWRIVFE